MRHQLRRLSGTTLIAVTIVAGCSRSAVDMGNSSVAESTSATDVETDTNDSAANMTNEQFAFMIRRLSEKGELEKAIELIEVRFENYPANEDLKRTLLTTKIQYSETLARLGRLDKAAQVMEEVGVLGRQIFDGHEQGSRNVDFVAALLCEARAHAYAGRVEECVASLEDALEHGFGNLDLINRDPFFAKLRSNDEYGDMITKILAANVDKELADFTPAKFDFTLNDLNGNPVSLADSDGKVRVIDIWGTWCEPCIAELPTFMRIHDQFENDVEVIGISIERTDSLVAARRAVQSVVDEMEIDYTCLIGNDKTIQSIPGFTVFPTTLFIDRNGKLRLRLDGTQSYDKLVSVIESLMAEVN